MKNTKTYLALLFCFFIVLAVANPVCGKEIQMGQIDKVEDPVTVLRSDGEKIQGKVNLPLFPGDQIETGKGGKAWFSLGRSGNFRLGEEAQLSIDELSGTDTGDGKTVLRLVLGYLWSKARFQKAEAGLEIHTPTMIAGVRGTEFDTVTSLDAASVVTVDEGQVEVGVEEEKVLLSPGKMIEIEADQKPSPPAPAIPQERRDWGAWQKKRVQNLLRNLPQTAPRFQKRFEVAVIRSGNMTARVNQKADEIQRLVRACRQAMAQRNRQEFVKARSALQEQIPPFQETVSHFRGAMNRIRSMGRLSLRVERFVGENKTRYGREELAAIQSSLAVISEKRDQLREIYRDAIIKIKETFSSLNELKREVNERRGGNNP